MDGTPIFDIKPYVPYADCQPEALNGFTGGTEGDLLEVDFPASLLEKLPENKRQAAIGILAHDPRPSYQKDSQRVYGVTFAGFDIRFTVADDLLTVQDVQKKDE